MQEAAPDAVAQERCERLGTVGGGRAVDVKLDTAALRLHDGLPAALGLVQVRREARHGHRGDEHVAFRLRLAHAVDVAAYNNGGIAEVTLTKIAEGLHEDAVTHRLPLWAVPWPRLPAARFP